MASTLKSNNALCSPEICRASFTSCGYLGVESGHIGSTSAHFTDTSVDNRSLGRLSFIVTDVLLVKHGNCPISAAVLTPLYSPAGCGSFHGNEDFIIGNMCDKSHKIYMNV